MKTWRGHTGLWGRVDNLLLIFKFLDGVKEETPNKRKSNKKPKMAQHSCFRELGRQEGRKGTFLSL
jgi:hypothetical protein